MWLIIFSIVSILLLFLSLKPLFEKAGVSGSKALIPGVNFMEWCQLIGRPKSHALWLLVPIVNLFVLVAMNIDLSRCFGRRSLKDAALSFLYAPLQFFSIARNNDDYLGPVLTQQKEYFAKLEEARNSKNEYEVKKLEANNPFKKSKAYEWADAIVFAVFAASFLRMFLIEPYKIPTPSMEGSLLVGDYLFVSKINFGIRPPMTPISIPLLHNRLPMNAGESYLKNPSLGYHRWLQFEKVEHNDCVVFNWPAGDSVILTPERSWDIGQIRNNKMPFPLDDLVIRPVDKKDHYVKRCIGLPGDSLKVVNRQVYINNKAITNPKEIQFLYQIKTSEILNEDNLKEWEIQGVGNGLFFMSNDQMAKVKSMLPKAEIVPFDIPNNSPTHLFPNDSSIMKNWNVDNYGPVYIPKKGVTVKISPSNIAYYRRVIGTYEGNKLEIKNGKVVINDVPVDSYTFKQDYYWMMGDNRHNSEDSRVWGFVPEDHIVGKPLFIMFSTKGNDMSNGIRWNRLFKNANSF
jgi:signal peptidase I